MKPLIPVFLALFVVFIPFTALAAEHVCNSCSNCTASIRSASPGDVVRLNNTIYADSEACINVSKASGITLDCDLNEIDGSDSYAFGIYLESNRTVIRDCTVHDFDYGIFVSSSHNLIYDTTSSGNAWAGIVILGEATNNTVRRSNFGSNNDQDGYGILLTGNVTYNRFIRILSASNKRGISIQSSSNHNIFTDALVFFNSMYGIGIDGSDYNVINDSEIEDNPLGIWIGNDAASNLIYNNRFDNADDLEIDSGLNSWNITKKPGLNIIGESCLGGNSWSNYTGQDPDGDGLGNIPYSLGMGNYDYLPLVHPPFVMTFANPTPANNSVLGRDWVPLNVSGNKALDACLLEWNGTNESMDVSGRYCYVNKTNLANGDYPFRVWGNESLGNSSATGERILTIDVVVPETLNFTVSVVNNTGGGLEFDLTVYHANTSDLADAYQTEGILEGELEEGTYDFLFESYQGNLQVLLRGVNISQNPDRTLGLDTPYVYGFVHSYAVESSYTVSSARLRLKYVESLFLNEDHIGVYVCGDWNFTGRVCGGNWSRTDAVQNKAGNYFETEVEGFSAFSLRQEPYCGDGACSGGETHAGCPDDCECDSGDTRPCSVAHAGRCAMGDEVCTDNHWEGCPGPETEACDGEDNNCDGVIDNVGGGTSVEGTNCGCYGGGVPADEVCNGIDDDCNGAVDDRSDCCVNGQTRGCGPANETGVCRKGTSTCSSNVWGPCEDAVFAKTEICGNEEDDDCDGETDEGCWDFLGLVLILLGVIILIVIVILYLHFRSQGRELTWGELKKKWTPAYQ